MKGARKLGGRRPTALGGAAPLASSAPALAFAPAREHTPNPLSASTHQTHSRRARSHSTSESAARTRPRGALPSPAQFKQQSLCRWTRSRPPSRRAAPTCWSTRSACARIARDHGLPPRARRRRRRRSLTPPPPRRPAALQHRDAQAAAPAAGGRPRPRARRAQEPEVGAVGDDRQGARVGRARLWKPPPRLRRRSSPPRPAPIHSRS